MTLAILDITAEQLGAVCRDVYEPSKYRDAPREIYLDHWDAFPPTTYLRVSFPERFTEKALHRLGTLRRKLVERHNDRANVVVCIYLRNIDANDMARHSIMMRDR